MKKHDLPPEFIIRAACQGDIWTIRKLVLSAKLDPTQLRWSQFWLVECDGKIVACGQLRNFGTAQELGSIVVVKAWRNRGLGTCLVQHLIAQATQPVYLECVGDRLMQFYTRLGFVAVSWQQLPQTLQGKFGVSQQLAKFVPFLSVYIMRYLGSPS